MNFHTHGMVATVLEEGAKFIKVGVYRREDRCRQGIGVRWSKSKDNITGTILGAGSGGISGGF